MLGTNENIRENSISETFSPPPDPVEPETGKFPKQVLFKWVFFLIFVAYIFLTFYHAPILTRIGEYLIIEHEPQKSDLIVCLGGGNIERGLASSDAFIQGLAPKIYISRPALPDSYDQLETKGLDYPEEAELLEKLLKDSGVPSDAIIRSKVQVLMTLDEALGSQKRG